jgi:DNA invertase Pin-like site-specific DNA recombinase
MATGDFVSYLRVSTDRQGISGLGIEAQREAVSANLNDGDWRVVSEYVEVESGKRSARPVLGQALADARLRRCPLVVANVSRLTRSLAFLSRLLESGVDVRFADLPKIEGPTGRFILQQMASVAELEAGLISDRTKKALAAAKARGKKLGGFRGHVADAGARQASMAQRAANADQRAANIAPVMEELRKAGVTSANGIARALTERGIVAPRGGKWTATGVTRILARIGSKAHLKEDRQG